MGSVNHIGAPKSATGFGCYNIDQLAMPVLLSVPHAGRDYPDSCISELRVPVSNLVRLEDRYADRLVHSAVAVGIPAIVAHRARAWIDLNRAESDLDPTMVVGLHANSAQGNSAKARGGLGLIPRRLAGCGELWRGQIAASDLEARIATFHRPYHAEIERLLKQMTTRFGVAVLIDVHTMPPIAPQYGGDPARIVVGDRFGSSASSRYTEFMRAQVEQEGYSVALNHPYSGDHILKRHGNPHQNIHAIQLEIDRSLYLDSALREPISALPKLAELVTNLAVSIADFSGFQLPIAAE